MHRLRRFADYDAASLAVVEDSAKLAGRSHGSVVDPTHLALALLRATTPCADLMRRHGITVASLEAIPAESFDGAGMTPALRAILAAAESEAMQHDRGNVTVADLLMGLVTTANPVGAMLEAHGVTATDIRRLGEA